MGSVTKFGNQIRGKNVLNQASTGHTKISFILTLLSIGILGYLGLKYIGSSDPNQVAYARYAFMLCGFAIAGYFMIDWLDNGKINFYPKKYNKIDTFKLSVITMIVFISAIMIDFILNVTIRLNLTGFDAFLYPVFAAVAEELFFRAIIINLIIKIMPMKNKKPRLITLIFAVLISSGLFCIAHLDVYGNNLPMLLSTFFGGILLGSTYIITRNISAVILAHGLKNVMGYINMVRFG